MSEQPESDAAEIQKVLSSYDDPYGFSYERYKLPQPLRSSIDQKDVEASLRRIIMLELASRIDRGEDVLDILL